MVQPTARKFIFSASLALATLSSAVASAGVDRSPYIDCHLRSVTQCTYPYYGEAYDNCYIPKYNACMVRRYFLSVPQRN